MPFCRSCGKELPSDATFCPSCGTPVVPPSTGPSRESEADRLFRDYRTQEFWFRRVIAYVIDWIIVVIVTAIIEFTVLLGMGIASAIVFANPMNIFVPFQMLGFGFFGLSAILFLLYFTLSEAMYHRTLGKSFMGLKVVTTDGSKFDIGKAFVRNFSKIYWLLLLLDVIGGLFMHVQPGQKFSDHVANTLVVSAR